MKILIVGGPGSGKTTLGRRLAGVIGAPCYDLDVVGYEGGAGPERSLAAKLADVATIARRQRWVAEGAFIGWTDALAEAADLIVWLDVPWRLARWRIVTRHARASMRGTNKHPGLRNLWCFMQNAKRYYADRDAPGGRAQTARWLAPATAKVYRCRTTSEIDALIARIGLHPSTASTAQASRRSRA